LKKSLLLNKIIEVGEYEPIFFNPVKGVFTIQLNTFGHDPSHRGWLRSVWGGLFTSLRAVDIRRPEQAAQTGGLLLAMEGVYKK
jgi:hypothetical protein